MQSTAVVALALLESVSAFQAPVMRSRPVQMFSEGDLGVLPPLGVYDPLGLIETRDMRRYEIMEIKHGRAAMLGFLHVIALKAGVVMPGYLSTSADLKFSDVPTGCFSSLEAVPTAGWLQIMVLTCMQEAGTGFASKAQTDADTHNSPINHGKGKRCRSTSPSPCLTHFAPSFPWRCLHPLRPRPADASPHCPQPSLRLTSPPRSPRRRRAPSARRRA